MLRAENLQRRGDLARDTPQAVEAGISGYADEQKRVLSATVGNLRLVCAYVPTAEPGIRQVSYKLDAAAFERWLDAELKDHPRLAVLGDFNIAPEDRDVHDPKAWEGQVLVSPPERAAFQRLLGRGLKTASDFSNNPRSHTPGGTTA